MVKQWSPSARTPTAAATRCRPITTITALVGDELPTLFGTTGWSLEAHGRPGWARQGMRDVREILRHGRRAARFPILLARRDG
jgi:hypothetical protein